MNELDQKYLEVVFGPGGGKERWRALYRKGSVLTLSRLPRKRDLPPLYRPQKTFSRLSCSVLGWLERFGITPGPWFETLAFSGNRESLVSVLEEETGGRLLELLIGNPVQSQRRFLGLLEGKGGRLAVVKAGFTGPARDTIRNEAALLEEFGGKTPGVPRLTGLLGEGGQHYRALLLPLIEGGRASESRALAHLQNWFQGGRMSLSSFAAWPEVARQWEKAGIPAEAMAEAALVSLEPVLEHGDYAPWNLLVDHHDDLWALDWEAGKRMGIPGLDWVHYRYQIDKLLAGSSFPAIIRNLDRRLQDAETQEFLKRAGWLGNHRWLLLVYLATNWLIPDDERPELLRLAIGILFPRLASAS